MIILAVFKPCDLLQISKITNQILSLHTRIAFMSAFGHIATVSAMITDPLKMMDPIRGSGLNDSYDRL